MDDRIRDNVKEPGPRPDPMLNEGPASNTRTWTVTAVVAAAVLAVMYGVTTHRAEVKDEQRQTEMPRDASPPAQPLPGGRTTAGSPTAPGATKPGG
jgi:hypothetical protein